MKRYFRLLIVAMLFCAAAHAQNALQWQPLREPGSGGWITSFRISPHDGKRMILGGDMLGAALSTDGGASWGPVFGYGSWEINDFTWHPTDANVVWSGTLMGPYKSSDGGRNFVAKRNGFPPRAGFGYSSPIERVLFDPNNMKHLLAFGGSSRGWDLPGQKPLWGAVWESKDGGDSWAKISTIGADGNTDDAQKGINIYGAEFAAGSSNTLYAVAPSAGFFASTDGGKTWTKRISGLPQHAAVRIQVHPRDANTLWISLLHAQQGGKSLPGGVFKSADGGQSWQPLNNGLSQKSDDHEINFTATYAALAVAPSDPDVMYTADGAWDTGVIYVSHDGGKNWRAAATKQNVGHAQPAELKGAAQVDTAMPSGLAGTYFAVDPKNANVAFNLGSEHIIATRDGGRTWRDEGNDKQPNGGWQGRGFSGWCSINARFNPYQKGQLVLQAMDAARVLITDDGTDWRRPLGDPSPWGGGDDVTFTSDGHIYATTGQTGAFQGIARSTDGGKSWQMLHGAAHGLPEAGWGKGNVEACGIYALPAEPQKVWACLGGKLYRSTDGGEKWTPANIGPGLKWFASDAKDGKRFFVSGANNVYLTADGGESWKAIGGPRKAGRMAVDSLGRLYIAANEGELGGLWRWDEKAEPKWTRLWDDGWIMNVAVDPANPNRLAITTNQNPYVETSKASGVWISGDAGATWTQANDGLPMLRGHAIAFNPFDSEELVHGTFGRGFFKARWAKSLVPQGGKSYHQTAADINFAQAVESTTPAKTGTADGVAQEITHIIRDLGPASFDYTYGGWKAEMLKPGDGSLTLDANEAGGAGLVLNGADIAPQKQTHLALRARLLPGNGATRLNVNLKGPEKTVTFDLTKLKANEFTTLIEPLGEGQFNNVLQVQIQGTNWSAAAQPLKLQIDVIGTTSTDEKANAAAKNAFMSDPTAGPPPKDKPSVPGWGFYPQFPQAWMQTHNGFVQRTKQGAAKQDINIVFLGDSITQGWGGNGKEVWEKTYAPLGTVNYGIGGDGTRQVLYRILNGEVDGIDPKLVVLKIGTNNLYGDFNAGSDEEIADGIQKIVATLREKLPKTKILLLGILPRQNDYFSNRTKHINELIKPLDDGKIVRFLDMSDQFQTAIGKVKPELFIADQLHLTKPGYELWAATMQPLFDEMLK